MGLLNNESWDKYLNKEVYVTKDFGMTGYRGILRDYNDKHVMVEDGDGESREVESEHVYGNWVLEDW